MSQPFVGQIVMFGGTFAPVGWWMCDGTLIPISENDALFALIGTTYGGDGQNTFAVPDLRSRVPVHQGQGQGLSSYVIGEAAGVESVTLTTQQLAQHFHLMNTTAKAGTTNTPGSSTFLADEGPSGITSPLSYLPYTGATQTTLLPATIGNTGGNQPHENRQSVQAINYIISLYGIFPPPN
jgi:microcystin-dependent protein